MITLPYSLVIEATKDPDFFGFYSNDLEGFTGIGHSIEDCLYKARRGMADHAQTLRDQGLPVPAPNPNPTIVIQNEPKLQPARPRKHYAASARRRNCRSATLRRGASRQTPRTT